MVVLKEIRGSERIDRIPLRTPFIDPEYCTTTLIMAVPSPARNNMLLMGRACASCVYNDRGDDASIFYYFGCSAEDRTVYRSSTKEGDPKTPYRSGCTTNGLTSGGMDVIFVKCNRRHNFEGD